MQFLYSGVSYHNLLFSKTTPVAAVQGDEIARLSYSFYVDMLKFDSLNIRDHRPLIIYTKIEFVCHLFARFFYLDAKIISTCD